MPVQRFPSFEAAREALWGEPGEVGHLRRVAWLWAFADRLYPRRFPRGVYRFTSIEDANLQRQAWDAAGARRESTPGHKPIS